jgi:hypothetical protein
MLRGIAHLTASIDIPYSGYIAMNSAGRKGCESLVLTFWMARILMAFILLVVYDGQWQVFMCNVPFEFAPSSTQVICYVLEFVGRTGGGL